MNCLLTIGRNCRFLQGPNTDREDVKKIRDAIETKQSVSLCLLNYKKDGSTFINQFFLCPLMTEDGKVAYYLGVQQAVEEKKDKQDGKFSSWKVLITNIQFTFNAFLLKLYYF